jgi:hypothetical protein
MAARFHSPHPARRRCRAGAPPLTAVPDRLAPVVPMPRSAVRSTLLVLLSCPICDYAAESASAAEAEQAAGAHDDRHHSGRPTAELHTVHTLSAKSTVGKPAGGPDFGGAA